jgi:proline iminopeptidase
MSFRQLADQFTLVFYDHRCNGRSMGFPVLSMTWENLTADADALRTRLGFERWAVLGHSFGGHVALEYALRYPDRVSHLVLMNTGGEGHWARENAPRLVAERHGPEQAELVRRWFHGEFPPQDMPRILLKLGSVYNPHTSLLGWAREAFRGRGTKLQPETFIWASRNLLPGWSVVDRLGGISVPTLVIAGAEDFVFPPECQRELAAGIPGARLRLIDRAGHNPHDEQTAEVMDAIREFIPGAVPAVAGVSGRS